nr:retrotransposon protein, putative, Ty1-copia subclass [Tanacetum cinerariifolium]
MRTHSSSNLPVESPPNPSTSNPKRRNHRRSKQPFILEESPVDTMADQCTMAELLRVPTEGYVEAIAAPPILAEQFELKHSLINMMTSDQFFGLEKDNPHDHIRCDANSNSYSEIAKLTHEVNQQTSVVTTAMTTILKQFQATSPPASVKSVEEICVTCGGAHSYYQCLTAGGNTFSELRDNIQGYVSAVAVIYNQERFDTIAGNPVKVILLKLNLPDHRSILTNSKVTPTKHRRMTKPYSSFRFIANCFMSRIYKDGRGGIALVVIIDRQLPFEYTIASRSTDVMVAATPQVMAIQGGRIQIANKKSLNAKGKDKGKGKGKDTNYIPKPKNPKPYAKEHPTKDDACHHYKGVRNCPVYLVELIKKKKQVDTASSLENQLGNTIKALRSDRGCEYISQEFKDYLKDCGSVHKLTPPYTPQHNGDYALKTAIHSLNMVPTKKVDKTPYELWYVEFLKKNLLSQEISWRAEELEEIQDEDTSPSKKTSEIPIEDEGFEPPQEEFVPVCRAIRILIAITAFYDYEIWQMDVKNAFLNCYLNGDIYIVQLEGFVDPNHPRKVCKLQISIYGLKKASRS